jgi:hypothetical protein
MSENSHSQDVDCPRDNKKVDGDCDSNIFSNNAPLNVFSSSSFSSLDGIASPSDKKNAAQGGNSSSSSSSSSTSASASSSNIDILHWAGKMNPEKSDSTSLSSVTASMKTTASNSDPEEGKKLKRAFSDMNVVTNKPPQSTEESGNVICSLANEGNESNSDNEGDDHNENNDDGNDSKGKKGGSSVRPNVREHSKAQREKRKGNISGLEKQAKELTDDLNDMNCQFISALETCRAQRQRQHRVIVSFLKLWMNDQSANTDSGGNGESSVLADISSQPIGNIIGFEARQAKWAALFSNPTGLLNSRPTFGGANRCSAGADVACPPCHSVSMRLPCTFSRFAPPMTSSAYATSSSSPSSSSSSSSKELKHISFDPEESGTGTKASRTLSSLEHIIADSTSLAVMCQNISEFGPVQICHFMLGIDVPMEDFISKDLIAIAPFYIYSKNATMCGGKFEIDLKGK